MHSKLFVFLHGFGEDERFWNDFLPLFHWPFPFYIPSFAEWHDCKSMDAYALKIGQELPSNQSLILVGHSMGGYIALALARLFPERIDRVVLLHSTASADTIDKKLNRDRTVEWLENNGTKRFIGPFLPSLFAPRFVSNSPVLISELKNRYCDLEVKGLIAATISMRDRPDSWEFLAKTKIPFLFILGEEDALIPSAFIVEKIQEKDQHKFVILQGVGHQGTYEDPGGCFQAISDFI